MTTLWKESHGTSFGSGLKASVVDKNRRAICFCLSIEEAERIARTMNGSQELIAALRGILSITDRDHAAWDAARSAIAKAEKWAQ